MGSPTVASEDTTLPEEELPEENDDSDPLGIGEIEAGPPDGWQPETSALQADTMLGRDGDSSEIRGTVREVYERLKPGTPKHLKACPLCGNARPLKKGEDVTVERLDHSLRVTVWADHGHEGERTTKTGKTVSNHYWHPPIPPFQRGDHVELGKVLADDLGGRQTASSTHEHGIRVYDSRDRSVANPVGGSWRPREAEAVERQVMKYAGRPVAAGDKVRMLHLRATDISGVIRVARSVLHDDGKVFETPWIGFRNGDLNTFSREFCAPESFHRVLAEHILPFSYDPKAAVPPRWESFLAEVIGDADKVAYLQEHVGACLHGMGARWQNHPILVGSGANGKSTLIKVLRALFQVSAVCSSSPSSWSQRFGRAQLTTSRLNLVTDMDERELLKDSGAIKAILSADPVQIEKKYKDPVTLVPTAGHVFACNRLPTSADRSHGFFRRFTVLRFDRVFLPHEQDHTLEDHLTSSSTLTGIYTWARQGYERRRERGYYTEPASHGSAVRDWREQSDSALAWASACLVPDATAREGSARLYNCYRAWCERTGHRPQAMRSWGETLATEHPRKHTKTGNYYEVRLVPDESVGALNEVPVDLFGD